MHHGQGGKSDESDIDAEKFFRFVAKRLTITILVLPVCHLYWLLYQSTKIFHKVSNNLSLLPNGINVNPKSIELDELKGAWGVMEPYNTIDKICDDYHQAKSHGLGSDNLSEVATAAVTGKVDTH
jgi:hypothetical protein